MNTLESPQAAFSCADCAEGRGLIARLLPMLALGNSTLDEMVSPVALENALARAPFAIGDAKIEPMGDPQSFHLADHWKARARLHKLVTTRDSLELVAWAAAKECLTVSGILIEQRGGRVSFEQLKEFASAMSIEIYERQPAPDSDAKIPKFPTYQEWLDRQSQSAPLGQSKQ